MKEIVRKVETSLEKGVKVFRERLAQTLKKIHWYAIWAWGFVGAGFGEGRCNFLKCD